MNSVARCDQIWPGVTRCNRTVSPCCSGGSHGVTALSVCSRAVLHPLPPPPPPPHTPSLLRIKPCRGCAQHVPGCQQPQPPHRTRRPPPPLPAQDQAMARLRSACGGLPAVTTATQELHGIIAAMVMQARVSIQPPQQPVSGGALCWAVRATWDPHTDIGWMYICTTAVHRLTGGFWRRHPCVSLRWQRGEWYSRRYLQRYGNFAACP